MARRKELELFPLDSSHARGTLSRLSRGENHPRAVDRLIERVTMTSSSPHRQLSPLGRFPPRESLSLHLHRRARNNRNYHVISASCYYTIRRGDSSRSDDAACSKYDSCRKRRLSAPFSRSRTAISPRRLYGVTNRSGIPGMPADLR